MDHGTANLSDAIRTLFRRRQFAPQAPAAADGSAGTTTTTAAAAAAAAATTTTATINGGSSRSLRPLPRFRSWQGVVACSVCGNDLAWREPTMGGRAVRTWRLSLSIRPSSSSSWKYGENDADDADDAEA